MNRPAVVSVIVPTRNSQATLGACLRSIANQTYRHIELIVVDRDSTDDTVKIAKEFTPRVFNHGPERSAQRNLGVARSSGTFVLLVDSDMELHEHVVEECVQACKPGTAGVVIPEVSFGKGFWAQCKALERSFYIGFEPVEAARFMRRASYQALGGYDESLVAGEDWDLSHRLRAYGTHARIQAVIRHNEGHISLITTMRKKYRYAKWARQYLTKSSQNAVSSAAGPIARYKLFLSRPRELFRNPIVGLGMLFMKTAEFGAGAAGYYGRA